MTSMRAPWTSTDIWASAQSCRSPDLSCRHHGHQRTRGQVCSPAKYDSHDSPGNVMTHEVEGALLNKYDSHDSRGKGASPKGGTLKSCNSQGLPETQYDLQGDTTMEAPLKQVLTHTPAQNKLRLNRCPPSLGIHNLFSGFT